MTYLLATKIASTGLMFALLFAFAIRLHGAKEPELWVQVVEALGFIASATVFFVFALVAVWMR